MARPYQPQQDNRPAAVLYRKLGFATIPLIPRSKTPALASPHPWGSRERGGCHGECGLPGHGFYDARTDVDWADRYWTNNPDDGIGVRPGPGVIVLDVDPRHGGDVTLAQLEARHGPLPETLTTISGRGDGGRHLWFDGVHGPVRRQLRQGVDILCHDRNFVVMPPSQHWLTRRPYTFKTPVTDIVPDAPQWLCKLATSPERAPRHRPRHARRLPPSMARRRCRGLIHTVANATEGERHSILYWAARRAAGEGLLDDGDSLYTALADAAADTGLPSDEIQRTISDAIAAAAWEGHQP